MKILNSAFVLLLIFVGIFTCRGLLRTTPDHVVYLPEFGGRVYPEDRIHPGTFTIKTDWGETTGWGKDAVMSIRNGTEQFGDGAAKLRAWRPDPKTTGVFEYSEIVVAEPVDQLHYCVLADNQSGRLVFRQERNSILTFGLLVMVICILSLILMKISMTPRVNRPLT